MSTLLQHRRILKPRPISREPEATQTAARRRRSRWQPAVALFLFASLSALVPRAAGDVVSYTFVVGVKRFDPTCTGARPSVVVNGQFPGPTIHAADGDEVRVTVVNNQSLPITIHWHGLSMAGSQWYDGVPGVTMCPIAQGRSYTHIFRIKGQWGTFWWHSHVAQLRNTLHGALIVQPPTPNAEPLDVALEGELLLLGGDWFTQSPQELTATIAAAPFAGYPTPRALHINGKTMCNPETFVVKPNKWYRLRVVNTAMWGSFNLQIENHTLVLHEAEGGYLKHDSVKWVDVYPGNSYSLLLYTGQRPANYWVVLHPRYDVALATARALGVLQYQGQPAGPPESALPQGPTSTREKNAAGPGFQAALRSPYVIQGLAKAKVTKLIMTEINLHTLPTQQQFYSMNNVTLTAPNGGRLPFLLADYQNRSAQAYSTTQQPDLPQSGLRAQRDGPFVATPAVTVVPYGAWVQIVFQNHVPPGGLHPWHTHGYNFYVVAQGTGLFNPRRWKRYRYNLVDPPYRNMVAMYENSWVAVRFRATNPGQWILHCHLEQHGDQGLGMVFKVPFPKASSRSSRAPSQLGPPPQDYPQC